MAGTQKIFTRFVIAAALLFSFSTNGQTWSLIGGAGLSAGPAPNPSITIDHSGVPYVVYEDFLYSQTANVKKFNGSAWIYVGDFAFSNAVSPNPSIVISGAGVPYVIYQDFIGFTGPSVMSYVGGRWAYVGGSPGISGNCSDFNSIAFDPSDNPYAVFEDNCFGRTIVKKYSGGSWDTIGRRRFSAGIAYNSSIAVDGSGTPYVVYEDAGNGYKATVMKFNGSDWVPLGIAGFSAGVAEKTTISIDAAGIPYVLYKDSAYGGKATVMKYNGSSWVAVGGAGFSAGVADLGLRSLVLDAGGTPYVAYTDRANGNRATVMKYNGTSWVVVGSAGFSAGSIQGPSIALDASGTPFVSFADSANGGKATAMRFDAHTGISGISTSTSASISVYPSPAHGAVTLNIAYPTKESASITITDLLGKRVKELNTITNTETKLQLDLPTGIYIISATVNDVRILSKVIVE